MSAGLIVVLVGGFWTLAYLPIQASLRELREEHISLRREIESRRLETVSKREFDAWKNERDKLIDIIIERQKIHSQSLMEGKKN